MFDRPQQAQWPSDKNYTGLQQSKSEGKKRSKRENLPLAIIITYFDTRITQHAQNNEESKMGDFDDFSKADDQKEPILV